MSKNRYLCIHGHFYQPPRENPWLEAVEVQDSAHPYHDWNERIARECYGPNAAARITSYSGKILDIRNNYRKISFNFGPSLLQWMERNSPEIYEDIVEADRLSVIDRQGHGNAMAQPWNHVIMPLATEREKLVQVVWGMEDFRERFGRDPEGMWLPECAVDLTTLSFLASNGIKFTILAPRQAKSFRMIDEAGKWEDCGNGRIDPTRPYLCTLPSGDSITLFFYDGPISQAIAFEGLLNDGTTFARRMMMGFNDDREWPQLLSVGTDGESYGHHHRHGEMALSYTLHVIERDRMAKLTNFGQYLSLHTPTAEVEIWDKSSWSCVHGVERWRSDCGCNSGMHGGWQQKWRQPLREAFRFLADQADALFEKEAPRYFTNPTRALLNYVKVLLDPGAESQREFLVDHGLKNRDARRDTEALRLMEIMRNAQLMFTSCAWFFDEVSGIETVQNMKYAGRLIQLLRKHIPHVESEFLELLREAPSNVPEIGNGAKAYARHVKPGIVDLYRVVAHHAIQRFDEEVEGDTDLFCYRLREHDTLISTYSGLHLKICRMNALSDIDGEEIDATVCVLHFGGHDFRCSITGQLGYAAYEEVKREIEEAFWRRSQTDLVRIVDRHFGLNYYTLDHLFSEGRRDLLQRITRESFQRFDTSIKMIYEENRKFMEYLLEAGAPLPQGFLSAADFVLKSNIMEELESFLETGKSEAMLENARELNRYHLHVGDPWIARQMEVAGDRLFHQLAISPSVAQCETARDFLEILVLLHLEIDLWEAQNIVFALVHDRPLPAHLERRVTRPLALTSATRSAIERLAHDVHVSLELYEQPPASIGDEDSTSSGGKAGKKANVKAVGKAS